MRFIAVLLGVISAGLLGWWWLVRGSSPENGPVLRAGFAAEARPHSKFAWLPWMGVAQAESGQEQEEADGGSQPVPVAVVVHVVDDNGRPVAGISLETRVDRDEYRELAQGQVPDEAAAQSDSEHSGSDEERFVTLATTRTSRNGTVSAQILTEVTTIFSVREGARVGSSAPVLLELGEDGKTVEGSTEIQVEVQEGGILSGRVTDASGRPVEGASVSATVRESDPDTSVADADLSTETDAEGRYLLHVTPGLLEVDVTAEHFQPFDAKAVQILPGRESHLDASLGEGLAIRGTVLDPEGEPVTPDSVRAAATVESEYSSQRGSGKGGDFVLEGLSPGRYALHVEKEGFLEDVTEVDAGGEPVTVRLKRASRLVGEVKIGSARFTSGEGEDPSPQANSSLASATIAVRSLSDPKMVAGWSSTIALDSSGHGDFATGSLPPGIYSALVTFGGSWERTGEIVLEAGKDTEVRVDVLHAGTTSMRGTVRGPDGALYPGELTVHALETAGFLSTSIDAEGHFYLPTLPPGDLEVTATLEAADQSFRTDSVRVMASHQDQLTLDLTATEPIAMVRMDDEQMQGLGVGEGAGVGMSVDESEGEGPAEPALYRPALLLDVEDDGTIILEAPLGNGGDRLRPGDKLASVDGVAISDDNGGGDTLLSGPKGSMCTLVAHRPASGETVTVALPRTEFPGSEGDRMEEGMARR